jgi:hypothetical protein
MKYFEAFGEGGFHSAFMTTYAFGSLAFEDIPFPKLRGAGCRNIVVLADRKMVNQSFADFGPPRFAGTSYHLVKADAPTAFHPKLTVLIGEKKGRLLVGSANLTALGLGGNKEQVASISYTEETPENAKFFIAAMGYLRRYVPQDDQWFPTSVNRALRSAPWLREDGFDPTFSRDGAAELNLLFDRPEITLLDQIVASINGDPIERLIIVSPYWDSQLEGLSRLKEGLGNPPTDILIENEASGFPSSALHRFSDVSLFDIAPNAEGRFLHAKLIIARGQRWDHVISGSMNCTYPALMGPPSGGNAEAGIYKRVPRGAALEVLELTGYEDARLHSEQLVQLQQSFEERDEIEPAVDGGTLTLQAGRIAWMAPAKAKADPVSIQFYDRDGAALAQIDLEAQPSASYALPPDSQRPKHGIVTFGGGIVSAPVQVIDLDILAVRTLPAQGGRKKRLIDTIAEAIDEDIELMKALTDLEALEDEEQANDALQVPKAQPQKAEAVAREYEQLSYEDFVRARTQANAQGRSFGLYMKSRHDRAANLISVCLNRMIGLVGVDLVGIEESDFQAVGAIDFKTTEPQLSDDMPTNDASENHQPPSRSKSAQNLATAKKFQEAVTAFETRCKAMAGKKITTSEMVRLRTLIQIILSHAQPVSGTFSTAQILPVYNAQGHDWPRLVGRLLLQHFGAAKALQNLTVEPDEAEQQRVLEYLALANWAAKAALRAVMSDKKAAVLRGSLERLAAALATQTETILAVLESDRSYYAQIMAKLDERFEARLGFQSKIAA